jgi:glycosidase
MTHALPPGEKERDPVKGLSLEALLALAACALGPRQVAAIQALAPDTSWVGQAALYEVFVQDFSDRGDFKGVEAGLDRIEQSGANVIWLMPVHPIGEVGRKGVLGSPYAARDFRGINPTYGSAQDLRALVEAAHQRNLKVILDWVPDHTSPDNPWVKEHPDWYVRNEKGEPSVPRDETGKLTDWTDVVQLDYGNPALRREMIATMQYWLQEFQLDGFRCDVAGFVPATFWHEALPALRASVPRPILLLAEWDTYELHRAGFDLTYGWKSYRKLKAVWQGDSAASYIRRELEDLDSMPKGGMRLRFTTNHDETAWDKPPVAIFGAGAGARAAYVATAFLPGRPLLYNGQEVESPQALPLFSRELIQWDQPRANEAREFYRTVLELVRTDKALQSDSLALVTTSQPKDIIAFRRNDLVILVNVRNRPARFTVKDVKVAGRIDLLTGETQEGRSVSLPAYGALVLGSRKR